MKKKGVVMQRDLEDQKEEMRSLQEKEQDLHSQIKMLEKEVSAHKKEIKTRDLAINEKEKVRDRIFPRRRYLFWKVYFFFLSQINISS